MMGDRWRQTPCRSKATVSQEPWQKRLIPPSPQGSFIFSDGNFIPRDPPARALSTAPLKRSRLIATAGLVPPKKAVRLEAPVSRTAGALVFQPLDKLSAATRSAPICRRCWAVFILRKSLPLYTSTWVHPARSRSSRARYCSTLASCKD
jgi:hypothetical protein